MIGYRHLIITACSIFLALGIGIMLGAVANFGPGATRQQAAQIKNLADKLDYLSKESDRDEELLRGNEEAVTAVTGSLVSHKLDGKRYAIVQTGDYPAATQNAADAITAAGGSIASITVVTNRITELDSAHLQQVENSLSKSSSSDDLGLSDVVRPLALAFQVGTTDMASIQTDLDTLVSDNIVTESGDYTRPITGVVIVGGSDDDGTTDPQTQNLSTTQVEEAILTEMANDAPHVGIVGCEPFDASKSSIPGFHDAGIASVDCIDLPIGALDLPYALMDSDHTAYGMKSTSTRRIPELLQRSAGSQGTQTANQTSTQAVSQR
jgi:hypothetical protein